MGSKSSKAAGNTVDHKNKIVQVYRVLQFIAGLLVVPLLIKGLRKYRKMIQGHEDRSPELKKAVALANHLTVSQK